MDPNRISGSWPEECWLFSCGIGMYPFKSNFVYRFQNVIQHRLCEPGIYANPEGLIHHAVTGSQITHYAIGEARVSRLTDEIAAEQLPSTDLPSIEKLNQGVGREGSCFP